VDGSLFGNAPRAIVEVEQDGEVRKNEVKLHRALDGDKAAIVNDILQGVVRQGTGRAAALPDRRPVAGKTGTTENYGDAWFVGYTPQLAVAVWVGYPSELRPMLTEFHGDAVAGGTYPALIWKSFMERAVPYLDALPGPRATRPEPFDPPSYDPVTSQLVVARDGALQRDNGFCREPREVVYFVGSAPRRTANCKPNEVDVPGVVGMTLGEARDRLAEQPLETTVIYKPAEPLQRTNVVLAQIPKMGRRLSSFEKVTLVLGKPLQGLVPNVQGATLARARRMLSKRRLRSEVVRFSEGPAGKVVSQSPSPGVAAARGMTVKLVVARG
jgi:membrane peptidoglycan carboxypeptidase